MVPDQRQCRSRDDQQFNSKGIVIAIVRQTELAINEINGQVGGKDVDDLHARVVDTDEMNE